MWQVLLMVCVLQAPNVICNEIVEKAPVFHTTKEACEETLPYHIEVSLTYLEEHGFVGDVVGKCVIRGQDS